MKRFVSRMLAAALVAAMMLQPAIAVASDEEVVAVEEVQEQAPAQKPQAVTLAAETTEVVEETEEAETEKTKENETEEPEVEEGTVLEFLAVNLIKPQIRRDQLISIMGDKVTSFSTYGFAPVGSSDIKQVSLTAEISTGKYMAYKKSQNKWGEGVPFTVRVYRENTVTVNSLDGLKTIEGTGVSINGENVKLSVGSALVKMYEDRSYTITPAKVRGYNAVLKVNGEVVAYPHTIENPTSSNTIYVEYEKRVGAPTEVRLNEGVTVAYGITDEEILAKLFNEVVVAEDAEVDSEAPELAVTAADCTISYAKDGLVIGENKVTVTYPGDGEYYDAASATVVINVTKGKATLKVGNTVVKYGEKGTVNVTVSPANVDYITVIGGMDAFVSGFVSIDVPESTKAKMRIVEPVFGKELFDGYAKLCELIGDGVSVEEFVKIVGNINDLIKEIPGGELIANATGFDISAFTKVVDVLTKLPSMDVKITLGNTPKNAGLYLVGAVVVDGHYEQTVGFGSYTVLRKSVITSSNISLGFINELPGKTLTAEAAAKFNFSACVFDDGEIVVPEKGLSVTFIGFTSKGRLYTSKTAPTEAGTYVETVALTIGNYRAFPVSRRFKISK